ncbi:major facilitator superfamily domain-containing protein [Lipomyces tetrasporus]|uniref:Major facilitator superfamily domain-containing protein n=1 Tax=Lipomyces tetrasporus TaxID=54092 RepID=A0AAD7QRX9_9ASCO|nr:major facilitator superfamily domain-containing protein [Lipomyces tetrasporus]KAJ8098687.1 major facilitator superfamily domain-containing protein [Lipomyces tetrasporus]
MMLLQKLFPRSGEKPYLLEVRASGWMIMTTIAVAVFTDIFLYGVIVPIVPNVLVDRIGVPQESVQRNISIALLAYAAGLLAASPVFGYLADLYQNRRLFMMVGLLALLGSTVILCLARVLWLFIFGWLVQGMSAAVVWTVGLALITDSFSEENIGKLMGVVSSSMSLGVFLGPLLGGVVYDRAGYYAVFGILFGLICVDILLRVFMLERKELKECLGKESSSAAGKSGRMINGLYMGVVIAWILTALESILPLRVETIFHWNTLGSGLIFLPIALTSLLSPLIGHWIDKHGPRWPLAISLVLACPFLVLLRLPENEAIGQIVLLFALLTLVGLASCMLLPSSMAEISTCVAAAEQKKPGIFGKGGAYGQAFGLFNLAYSAGSVFGPLEAGFVSEADGWGTATWTLGLISFVSAIPAILFTGGFLFKKRASIAIDAGEGSERTQAPSEEAGVTVVVAR